MSRIVFLLLAFLIFSCEEPVRFLKAQPEGIEDSKGFNKKYQGNYINPEDSSFLKVTQDQLIRHKRIYYRIGRTDLDSSLQALPWDEIAKEIKDDSIPCVVKNDSIFYSYDFQDTIFKIYPNTILRYYQESYFLNTQEGNYWDVARLSLNKNVLSISYLFPNDSLFASVPIENIHPIKTDSGQIVNYEMSPSRKELKKLIKADGFKEVNWWVRVK